MNETDELDRLIHGYLDGSLDPAEVSRLNELLASDPRAAQRLAAMAFDQSVLSGESGSSAMLQARPASESRATMKATGTRARRTRRRENAPQVWLPVAVAAAAAIAVLLWLTSGRPSSKVPSEANETTAENDAPIRAKQLAEQAAKADSDRRAAMQRIEEIEERRRKLAGTPNPATNPPEGNDLQRQNALAELEAMRAAAERELQEASQRHRETQREMAETPRPPAPPPNAADAPMKTPAPEPVPLAPEVGRVVFAHPTREATLIRSGVRAPLREGAILRVGDRIETPPNESETVAAISLIDKTGLDLGGRTNVELPSATDVRLVSGRIYVDTLPAADRPAAVQTAAAKVSGNGAYVLSFDGQEARMQAERGTLRFSNDRGSYTVGALQSTASRIGRAPDMPRAGELATLWRGRREGEIAAKPAATYVQVAFDDFDDRAGLEKGWGIYRGAGNGGIGTRAREAVSVENGILTITARGDLSGGIAQRMNQIYGKWEILARVDKGTGYGPGLLLWPQSEKWPDDGEIDIMECFVGSREKMSSFIHYGSKADHRQVASKPLSIDVSQWRTYVCEWTPDAVRILVDGQLVLETKDADVVPDNAMHLAIQLDVGAEGRAIPARDDTTPAEVKLQVDWVKVYKLAADPTEKRK